RCPRRSWCAEHSPRSGAGARAPASERGLVLPRRPPPDLVVDGACRPPRRPRGPVEGAPFPGAAGLAPTLAAVPLRPDGDDVGRGLRRDEPDAARDAVRRALLPRHHLARRALGSVAALAPAAAGVGVVPVRVVRLLRACWPHRQMADLTVRRHLEAPLAVLRLESLALTLGELAAGGHRAGRSPGRGVARVARVAAGPARRPLRVVVRVGPPRPPPHPA